MSTRTESLPVKVQKRPWMPWIVATIALAAVTAGTGSYLMLRSTPVERSPAVTRTAPAPALFNPAQPPQPAATPAGPRIPELAGVNAPIAGGAGSTSPQPLRPGSRDAPGLSAPACASTIGGGPC